MNSLKKIMMTITLLLSVIVMNAQIKNTKTETVKIYGNCGMCKSKIEKAFLHFCVIIIFKIFVILFLQTTSCLGSLTQGI